MKLNQYAATLYGVISILLWSTMVGLIRSVSENFGSVGGRRISRFVVLVLVMGIPKITKYPKRYLLWGTVY